jgi:hypothetical protein
MPSGGDRVTMAEGLRVRGLRRADVTYSEVKTRGLFQYSARQVTSFCSRSVSTFAKRSLDPR